MTSWKLKTDAPSSRWISREYAELLAEVSASGRNPEALDFDVLIVGSGYGGAIAAAELAGCSDQNGIEIRIGILERGREYLPGAFPSRMADLPTHVRGNFAGRGRGGEGLFDIRAGADVGMLLANGLGGGSLINAGVMLEPEQTLFDQQRPDSRPGAETYWWPASLRNPKVRTTLFNRAKTMLGSRDDSGDNTIRRHAGFKDPQALRKLQVLRRLAPDDCEETPVTVAMTAKATLADEGVNLKACTLCGDCATGCNYAAKESLDTNLLVLAHRRKARIFCGATVLRIRQRSVPVEAADDEASAENGQDSATHAGWEVLVCHTDEKLRLREGRPRWIATSRLILSAGALGSTEILMRSQRANPELCFSALLGKRFSANGDMIAFGYDYAEPGKANGVADEDQPPAARKIGPTNAGVIRTVAQSSTKPETQYRIAIEELTVPGPLRRAVAESITTANTLHSLGDYDCDPHTSGHPTNDPLAVHPEKVRHILTYAVMGDDGAGGTLCLAETATDHAGDGHIAVVWPEAKHHPLFEAQSRRIEQMAKAAGFGGRTIPNPLWRFLPDSMSFLIGNQRGPLVTVHPLGGCPLGDTAANGVVNEFGQVFDARAQGSKATQPYPGLVVLDGAIVPSALAINPALTISVLALRAVEHLRDSVWKWTRPEFEPESAVDRPVIRTIEQIEQEIKDRGTQPTMAEFTERLGGKMRLRDGEGKLRKCWVDLSLSYEPLPLSKLFQPDDRGSLAGAQLTVPPPRPGKVQGQLRIFLENEWWNIKRLSRGAADRENREKQAALSYSLKGSLIIHRRERSSALGRTAHGLCAWVLNRGLRDIAQAVIARCAAKKRGEAPTGPGPLARARGALKLASRAGEVRRFDYVLEIVEDISEPRSSGQGHARFVPATLKPPQKKISGSKRITYARPSNPWRQLQELRLDKFPFLACREPLRVLKLDPQYLAGRRRPLFGIVAQRDHLEALADVVSLGAYFLRMMLSIHVWTARKPDAPRQRKIERLPGRLAGLPEPDVHEIVVDRFRGEPVKLRLTRYRGKPEDRPQAADARPPIVMIHGYSVGGTSFAHPSLEPSLAQFFAGEGRDVWVVDLRSSPGLPTAVLPWTFERMAFMDIPAAIDYIWFKTGEQPLDVIAHCMGSAMFSMGVLSANQDRIGRDVLSDRDLVGEDRFRDRFRAARQALPERINKAVLSQIGPVMVLSQQNIFRAYVMSFFEQMFGAMPYFLRPEPDQGLAADLLDRLLATLPYSDEELRIENPWQPWRRTGYLGTRHRMDALYGSSFKLRNVRPQILEHFDDFFGPLNLGTVSQVIHFAQYQTITNRSGRNRFVNDASLRALWRFPTLSIHGRDNELSDPSTVYRMWNVLKAAGCDYRYLRLEDFGHQDWVFARNVLPTFGKIRKFLEAKWKAPAKTSECFEARIPWLGPTLLRGTRGSNGRNLFVSMGADPQLGIPGWLVYLPVRENGGHWEIDQALLDELPEERGSHHAQETNWPLKKTSVTDWFTEQLPQWTYRTNVRYIAVLLLYRQSDAMDPPSFDAATQDFEAMDESSDPAGAAAVGAASMTQPRIGVAPADGDEIIRFERASDRGTIARLISSGSIEPYGDKGAIVRDIRDEFDRERHKTMRQAILDEIRALNRSGLPQKNAAGECLPPLGVIDLWWNAPVARPAAGVNLVLGSCQYPPGILDQEPAFRSWERLGAALDAGSARPDLMLLTGDQIYADGTAGLFDPSLGDDRYAKPYERWLRNRHVRNVTRRVPAITLLDDHEIDENWEPIDKRAPEEVRQRHRLHHIRGKASFKKYQRTWDGTRGWFDCEVREVPVFVLDTRGDRQQRTAGNIDHASIMTATQMQSLRTWLTQLKDDQRPKIVVSSAAILPRHLRAASARLACGQEDSGNQAALRSDGWDAYPASLYGLLDFIARTGVRKLVFLSGDEHLGLFTTLSLRSGSAPADSPVLKIHSIHTAGLYTPLRFANAQPPDLLLNETFEMSHSSLGSNHRCTVESKIFPGAGFTFIRLRQEDSVWKLHYRFDPEVEETTITLD